MTDRLAKELAMLKTHFPDIEFLEQDYGWFRIPRYAIPPGTWNSTECSVCFQVPAGYPGEPPYAFWTNPMLRLAANGGPPVNNYQEPSPTPFCGTWGKFSWQHDKSWQPGAEPDSGTNLLDFAITFKDRLREGA